MLFPYFVYIAHLEALFSRKNLCSWKNQKSLVKEKGKITGPKKKERVPFCQEKKLRCDSDWYWRSSTLTSRFRTKKSPSNQSLPCYIMLKTRFPFPYASTGLDTKTLTIASNRNSESCRSIRCLAPQHIFRFFHFCHGFPLPLATWLIFVSSSSTLHWAIEFKKRSVCNGLLFPGNLDLSSLTPAGPVVPLVCGLRRLLAWRELFANLCELKSHIWFWKDYNPFERIYRVNRFDRFSSNFA